MFLFMFFLFAIAENWKIGKCVDLTLPFVATPLAASSKTSSTKWTLSMSLRRCVTSTYEPGSSSLSLSLSLSLSPSLNKRSSSGEFRVNGSPGQLASISRKPDTLRQPTVWMPRFGRNEKIESIVRTCVIVATGGRKSPKKEACLRRSSLPLPYIRDNEIALWFEYKVNTSRGLKKNPF